MIRVFSYLLALLFLLPAPASAHLTPNSEVQIDFGQDRIVADVIIPQGEYSYASGNNIDNDAASRAKARVFLTRKFRVTTAAGKPWRSQISTIEFVQIAGPPDLHAIMTFTPPAGASARDMVIEWSAVIDVVPNHFALFVARSDFGGGKLDYEREILGALQGDKRTLAINRGAPDGSRGFFAAIGLGMHHIAIGYDHVLFLIALLLPAPLLAAARRWANPRDPRDTLWSLAKIVTAFTIGHSVTLIGAAVFALQLPAQPVEILIALSILISAIHAWRPLFPGRESYVAAGFGLIHGLAFATIVGNFGLGFSEKALSILGFNIGIEMVQLLIVLATMPCLLLLARTPYYPPIRTAIAGFAAIAALAWVVERIWDTANPVAEGIDAGLAYSPVVVLLLTGFAIWAHWRQRRQIA